MAQLRMKKLAGPREVILLGLISTVIVFMFWGRVYSPKSLEAKEVKTKLKTIGLEAEALKKETAKLKEERGKKIVVKDTLDSPNVKIQILKGSKSPEFTRQITLLDIITSKNFKKNVMLGGIVFQGQQESGGYQKTPMGLKVSGSFAEINEFISTLDSLEALVSVDSIFMTRDAVKGNQMASEIAITLYQVEGIHATDPNL